MTDQFEAFMTALSEYKEAGRAHMEYSVRHHPVYRVLAKLLRQPASRAGQKKSVASKRKNRAPRNRKIRKFDAEKRKTNPNYSIAQLSRDLMRVRGTFYEELRLGGKFPTDETLRRIARPRKKPENTPKKVQRPGLS